MPTISTHQQAWSRLNVLYLRYDQPVYPSLQYVMLYVNSLYMR